jgi:hypothetical protein
MTCKWCGLDRVGEFKGEIAIHFPGLKGLERLVLMVSPNICVCLSCGNAEFAVSERELHVLATESTAVTRG